MHSNKITISTFFLLCMTNAQAADISSDGTFQINGYGMVGGDFQSEQNRSKSMSLHEDPTGPHQDPRGKMGELGNNYWHDYFTSLAITKKWTGVGAPEQWADYTYQVVGYGDKSIETAQNFGRFGGLNFLPQQSVIWAGRRYLDERVGVLAYNTKEIHVDSGVGYNGKDLDITIGTAQIDWSGSTTQAIEGSRRIVDLTWRYGPTEWEVTHVKELDNPLGTGVQQALSFAGKYTMSDYLGIARGSSSLKLQYGKGVIAQYLNTSRITVISEEGDSAFRFTADGVITQFDDFLISPAFIYEYTRREKTDKRTTAIPNTYYGGTTYYGSANETGMFGGINIKQNLHHQNISMLYEAIVNHTTNKNGVNGADGTAYKISAGPALQLDVLPYVAPIVSFTLTYAGGDRVVTQLPTDSEWRLGYRLEVWF